MPAGESSMALTFQSFKRQLNHLNPLENSFWTAARWSDFNKYFFLYNFSISKNFKLADI